MAKSYTGTATIDRRLQIVRADKQFYEYIGFENYASLAGSVHPKDLEYFREAVSGLGVGETSVLVVRIMAFDEQYHYVLAELSVLSVEGARDAYIEIKIEDIVDMEDKLSSICDENCLYNEFLDMLGEYLFIYNIKQDSFQIFNGGNSNRVYSFRGTIADFQKSLQEKKLVDEEYLSVFQELCQDIGKGTKHFEYRLRFLSRQVDPEKDIHIVKGRTILNAQKEPIVLGCILRRSNVNGKTIDYIQSDYDKDVTTGLLTKRAIIEYTENLLRHKPKYNVNLCVVDLDNFKQVNDTLGHLFGDEVLATVADIIKEAVAGKGLAGRIGGDEMFVVLEGINSRSDLRGILRSIRSNVEWAYKDRKDVPTITCSIGVSTYPNDALVYDDLFKIADKMLYRAKQKGKNRYIVYAADVHGDVLSEQETVKVQSSALQRQDKEDLVLKMLEYVAQQANRPFDMLLGDVGSTFCLDEVHLFYGDNKKRLLESYWNADGGEMLEESFADYVHEANFVHLYREHDMAVIDNLDLIEQLCPQTHKYLMMRGVRVALVYKMNCRKHEGYIVYCKMSDMARKWSDSDMANLTYISKMIELLINDR